MKRFVSTEKWADPWYRKLPPRQKCFWEWLCAMCDAAGSIDIDYELASFQIGAAVSEGDLDAFGERIVRLPSGRYWITGFIDFQYTHLSEACKAHGPVYRAIADRSIPYGIGYQVGYRIPSKTRQRQDKDTEKEKDKEKDAFAVAVKGGGVGEGVETWKTSYPIYKSEHDAAYARLSVDLPWLAEQERLNPGINAGLSLEKAARFWGREEGWRHKKRKRTVKLNWTTTYESALSMPGNKVYRPRTTESPGRVVEDNHYRQVN